MKLLSRSESPNPKETRVKQSIKLFRIAWKMKIHIKVC